MWEKGIGWDGGGQRKKNQGNLIEKNKNKKYLKINLTKDVKGLSYENCQTLKKETEEDKSVKVYAVLMNWKG